MFFLLVAAVTEYILLHNYDDADELYRIEINRVERMIEAGEDLTDLSGFTTIIGVTEDDGSDASFFDADERYVIRGINGKLYRIEYKESKDKERRDWIFCMNLILLFVFLTMLTVMTYVYTKIIRQFYRLSEYPYLLAKGNLTLPLKESRNHYFGHFIWGLDMLRERLEDEKEKNLNFNKEKNLFLLSLSHDTKTPLSAIKLYAAAMKKNLYKDPEKQREIAAKIDENADQIEDYITKIIASAGDEFMNFEVNNSEFYLSWVIKEIKTYYGDKLSEAGCEFIVSSYSDIMLKGDPERMVEVLQNLIENAIKYGDGLRIGIEFADEDNARLITVSNTGCNLPKKELEHIFDSFYRGSNVGSRKGSGLGLYICKKLMNKMQGDIFAEIEGDVMKVTAVCQKC